jgi:hypothetical protein
MLCVVCQPDNSPVSYQYTAERVFGDQQYKLACTAMVIMAYGNNNVKYLYL